MIQEHFHVVLVEPEDSLNIGCVARAMLNCGFKSLLLVNPKNYDPEKAAWSACWATEVLNSCQIYSSLSDAISDMTDVVGFTARQSNDRRNHKYLAEWSKNFVTISKEAKIALLFGNERTGLTNNSLRYCSTLIRIPSSAENPSYNLAQAVLLALYELYSLKESSKLTESHPASVGELIYLDKLIKDILINSGFKSSSPAVDRILSNVILRIKPDKRELGILLAVFDHLKRIIKPKAGS